MDNRKYTDGYVKGLCTMISRGDILDIETFKNYLEYLDLDTSISAVNAELNMLLNIDLNSFNPKYYISDFGSIKEYAPIDLILYSCVCNNTYYTYKRNLLKEILSIETIDFSNIYITLEHAVSKGDLELFNLLISLNPDLNLKCSSLKTGEPISILDNCLSLAICRLTINGEYTAKNYPKEILEYFLSLKNVDFSMLVSTKIILEVILKIDAETIENNSNIFKQVKFAVENYNKWLC